MISSEVARHIGTVRELSRPGKALAPGAPTATVNNPTWWVKGEPTPSRERLHWKLLEDARSEAPNVQQNRKAIVLAGPPGAGKSTVLSKLLGDSREEYLVIDADEFKRSLLREAQADGSYETWLVPDEVRRLEVEGERFFPLELASLVHEESSYLAKALRTDAIDVGDNLVIDTVLSDPDKAVHLGQLLSDSGYEVRVVDVEVPFEVSEARIRGRWKRAYEAALRGEDVLGGRWVPSEYSRSVFAGPEGRSLPEHAALQLARSCPAVSRYQVFRTTLDRATGGASASSIEVDMVRGSEGAQLITKSLAETVQRAALARPSRPVSPTVRGGLER